MMVVVMGEAVGGIFGNRFVLRGGMGVEIGMGGNFHHEEFFAEIRDDGIAEGGDTDGAEVADEQDDPETCFSAVEFEE